MLAKLIIDLFFAVIIRSVTTDIPSFYFPEVKEKLFFHQSMSEFSIHWMQTVILFNHLCVYAQNCCCKLQIIETNVSIQNRNFHCKLQSAISILLET